MNALLEELFGLERQGMKLGLDPTTKLLRRCGDPHRAMPVIQIAGTNGKGSTAAFAANILQTHGRKVGLFTSPHLNRFNERIRVNGIPVSDGPLVNWIATCRSYMTDLSSTFFEATTVMAVCLFRDAKVDWAILETGLGGRLDAVTACLPTWTALTPIDLDHVDILGDTLEAIAREKAGILRRDVPCFSALQHPQVSAVLHEEALRAGTRISAIPDGLPVPVPHLMPGVHQHQNAKLAWTVTRAVLGADFDETLAARTIETTLWPGRYQQLQSSPRIVYDVGHNPHGIAAFLKTMALERPEPDRIWLVLALQKGKNTQAIVDLLVPAFDRVCVTQTDTRQFFPAEELAGYLKGRFANVLVEHDPVTAIAAVRDQAAPEDYIAIVGSHYLGPAVAESFKISFDKLS